MAKEVPDMIDYTDRDGNKHRVPNPFRESTIGHFEHGKSDGERAIESIDGTLKREISEGIQHEKSIRQKILDQEVEDFFRNAKTVGVYAAIIGGGLSVLYTTYSYSEEIGKFLYEHGLF